VINYNPSDVRRKTNSVNFDPLLKKVVGAHVYPPKINFLEDYMPAPRGCSPLKFFTCARKWLRLANKPTAGTGSPKQSGRQKRLKLGTFSTTLDFDRKYQERIEISKSEKEVISNSPSHVKRKNLGELRSTNKKVKRACWPTQDQHCGPTFLVLLQYLVLFLL